MTPWARLLAPDLGGRLQRRLASESRNVADRVRPTRVATELVPPGELRRRLEAPSPAWLDAHAGTIEPAVRRILRHEFDLLGSGPTVVRHGADCAGLEGHRFPPGAPVNADPAGEWLRQRLRRSHVPAALAAYRRIEGPYVPIDWQLDFKSGFRWSERESGRDVRFGHVTGADVKVPWELGRLQHLPLLAFGYALGAHRGDSALSAACAREMKNQVHDFVAANPPRFGVQWACTMDVALRAVSLIVGYDLIRASGADLGAGFDFEMVRCVYEHGLHVVSHLEWSEDRRDNHYLADVAGLLFVASSLPAASDVASWQGFAAREVLAELEGQFEEDGGNFEGSTAYHALSAEMVAYSVALLLGAPKHGAAALPRLGDGHVARIERMKELLVHATRPTGFLAPFGDADSGRFLKLGPGDREDLVSRPVIVALAALFDGDEGPGAPALGSEATLERAVVRSLAREGRLSSPRASGARGAEAVRVGARGDLDALADPRGASRAPPHSLAFDVTRGDLRDLRDGIEAFGYPRFGLWVWRSPRLFLAVRCGPIGRRGAGGHDHNDQLSLELFLDGAPRVVDPGTFVYTALPELRNAYRSVRAHFAPRTKDGREPARFAPYLFVLEGAKAGKCMYFGEDGFVGEHEGFGVPVRRIVRIEARRVVVADLALGPLDLAPLTEVSCVVPTTGYGHRDPAAGPAGGGPS